MRLNYSIKREEIFFNFSEKKKDFFPQVRQEILTLRVTFGCIYNLDKLVLDCTTLVHFMHVPCVISEFSLTGKILVYIQGNKQAVREISVIKPTRSTYSASWPHKSPEQNAVKRTYSYSCDIARFLGHLRLKVWDLLPTSPCNHRNESDKRKE